MIVNQGFKRTRSLVGNEIIRGSVGTKGSTLVMDEPLEESPEAAI